MTLTNDTMTTDTAITEAEIYRAHEGGKLGTEVTAPLADARALSIAYTPGVATMCTAIAEQPELADRYTWASRLVAVVSDGSAVLGLGDIGASASLPVMEGKAALFKTFGGLDSIPLVLNTNDVDEIVRTMVALRPSFGAVNLEDVSAPRCFELEDKLIEALDCPVMHDDQHGTAVVTLAALRGACTVLGKRLAEQRVVIHGSGAAGVACARILNAAGVAEVIMLDSKGILHRGRDNMNAIKTEMAIETNHSGISGGLDTALHGADVFIGLSGVTIEESHLAHMADDAIVFALSNPTPELHPEIAAQYASVVATGRSDFPNQINNVLAFPGIFRGALDAGARKITANMKLAAAEAIAAVASDDLAADRIVPSVLDPRVGIEVAEAVARAAEADGVARTR